MSIDLYKLYRADIFRLAKTMVVKSNMLAESINEGLRLRNIAVSDQQPLTWKYYKNIAGEYHSTDTVMQVISFDTLEVIDFTVANLAIHRATAKSYAYGTKYYNDLIAKYPNQTQLILGILNPVDKQKAIDAEEGTILYYDTKLVEENEVNLIDELEGHIKRFLRRWNTYDYRLIADLYLVSMLSEMYLQIPMWIANIRLANCKTNLAHSYHIREYLASHGYLDRYIDILTKKQALFLYRNIRYIEANAGKQSTFELLVQKILTDRGFPLVAYDLMHNTVDMPDDLYPTVELLQKDVNEKRYFGYTDSYTVDEILDKEVPLAINNALVQPEATVDITNAMETSRFNALPTKVLESSIIDDSDTYIKTFAKTLIDHWCFFSAFGYYRAVVNISHPITGERLTLSAKDAFVLLIYAKAKMEDITFTNIPSFEVSFVRKLVLPTVSDIKKLTNKEWVTTADINEALNNQLNIRPYVSIEGFYDDCVVIHKRIKEHYLQYATIGHRDRRAHVKTAVFSNYYSPRCTFYTNRTFASWFQEKAVDVSDFTFLEWELLANDLIRVGTGASLVNKKTLKEIHEGLMAIMAQLSSYNLEFIPEFNNGNLVKVDVPEVLLGNLMVSGGMLAYIPPNIPGVRQTRTGFSARVNRGSLKSKQLERINGTIHAKAQMGISYDIVREHHFETKRFVPISVMGIRSATITQS